MRNSRLRRSHSDIYLVRRSAHPPEGFYSIGKFGEVSYKIKKRCARMISGDAAFLLFEFYCICVALTRCTITFYFASAGCASAKMILFTTKNTTMETPPFKTVVPMLYTKSGTSWLATATHTQLMEFTIMVITIHARK